MIAILSESSRLLVASEPTSSSICRVLSSMSSHSTLMRRSSAFSVSICKDKSDSEEYAGRRCVFRALVREVHSTNLFGGRLHIALLVGLLEFLESSKHSAEFVPFLLRFREFRLQLINLFFLLPREPLPRVFGFFQRTTGLANCNESQPL